MVCCLPQEEKQYSTLCKQGGLESCLLSEGLGFTLRQQAFTGVMTGWSLGVSLDHDKITDLRKQLVITLASQSLSQVQMLHLFVPLLPYHPHLLFTYNDAFLLSLSWEKDIRAAWTHPKHCWWKFRKRPWTHLRMSRVKIRAGGGGKRGSYFSSVPISKNIGLVDLTNRTPQMQ